MFCHDGVVFKSPDQKFESAKDIGPALFGLIEIIAVALADLGGHDQIPDDLILFAQRPVATRSDLLFRDHVIFIAAIAARGA